MRNPAWLAPAVAAAAILAACGGSHTLEVDASASDAGSAPRDSSVGPRDAGVDAGTRDAAPVDSGMFDAGETELDGSTDASTSVSDAGSDAATDAGDPCATCTTSDPCQIAACIGGVCLRASRDDGEACDAASTMICVDGACVARGCGDGYRDPASSPFEECDDGNLLEGDFCSSTCGLTTLAMPGSATESEVPTRGAPVIARSGGGSSLLVWIAQTTTDEIRARRFTPEPVPVDEPGGFIVIATGLARDVARPVVAGLTGGGWVVVWSVPLQIHYVVVAPDGTVGTESVAAVAGVGGVHGGRAAGLGTGGFVIVWDQLESGFDHVGARIFDAVGAPTTTATLLFRVDVSEAMPAVASDGDTWMLAWVHRHAVPSEERVYVQRYRDLTPVDPAAANVASVRSSQPSVVATASGYQVGFKYDVPLRTEDNVGACLITSALLPPTGESVCGILWTQFGVSSDQDEYPLVASIYADYYAIGWQRGYTPTSGGAIGTGGYDPGMPAIELGMLDAFRLAGRGHIGVASGPRGVWVTWRGPGPAIGPIEVVNVAYLRY